MFHTRLVEQNTRTLKPHLSDLGGRFMNGAILLGRFRVSPDNVINIPILGRARCKVVGRLQTLLDEHGHMMNNFECCCKGKMPMLSILSLLFHVSVS